MRKDARAIALLSREEVEHGLPWQWTPRKLKRFLALEDTNAYVAYNDKTLAGFAIASLGDVRAHLVLLAVRPAWRRAGLGSHLLRWQLEAAQTAGSNDMTLELRNGNHAAIKFYEAAGFVQTRKIEGYYNKQEDALRFRLRPIRVATTRTD